MSGEIESVMQESRIFPAPEAFVAQANVSGMEAYQALCAEAQRDHGAFWARMAHENLIWKNHLPVRLTIRMLRFINGLQMVS